jgi:FkbM family methyltransferase
MSRTARAAQDGGARLERAARAAYRSTLGLPAVGRIAAALMPERIRRALRQSVLVEESARYALAASVGASGVRRYHLRHSGDPVLLRHPTDSWTFEEIFRARAYAPPRDVECALDALPRRLRVIDLGANVGLFTRFVLDRWPSAKVLAVEPDPVNAKILRRHLSLAGDETVDVREAAAGPAAGSVAFESSADARSRIVPDARRGRGAATIDVPAVDVLPALSGADLAKLDIEGAEWPILADPRLAEGGPRVLVVEYHADGCPSGDPRAHAESLLLWAGYRIVPPPRPFADEEFPERQGMLWAMRD